jgi:RNA polymerase sigma-70 factor (ECF subfamily)
VPPRTFITPGDATMQDNATDFGALMRLVREGSQDAARELVHRFEPNLLRMVGRRLHPAFRCKFDPCDFTQEVWAAFFAISPDRHRFERPEQLAWFLGALAHNKVVEAVRQRLVGQKYNVNRERCLDVDRHEGALKARQPSPPEIAIAREEWKLLLRDQPEHYRQILAGLRDGHTQREIAIELKINQRTVRRVVRNLARDRAATMNTADVNARLRRLRELADGLRAELELIPKPSLAAHRYEKAIRDAQQAHAGARHCIPFIVLQYFSRNGRINL